MGALPDLRRVASVRWGVAVGAPTGFGLLGAGSVEAVWLLWQPARAAAVRSVAAAVGSRFMAAELRCRGIGGGSRGGPLVAKLFLLKAPGEKWAAGAWVPHPPRAAFPLALP